MDLDTPTTNGTANGKRKSRASLPKSYKEDSGDSDGGVGTAVRQLHGLSILGSIYLLTKLRTKDVKFPKRKTLTQTMMLPWQ